MELCGKKRGMEMSLFLYGNPVEILRKSVETYGTVRNSAEKNRGMEMSPAEMREKCGKAWK